MRAVAVLGGGIGGLASSYYLCKNPQVTKVILLESSSRFGGWLQSTRRADGTVFEHGPRGIRSLGAVGRNTLNMVEDLGLEPELLSVNSRHVASRNRFLYIHGQLHSLPKGISGLLRTNPPFSRPLLWNVVNELLVKKSDKDDESVHSFFSRRLGAELADVAVDCLCRGVFAGDSKRLSIRSCLPMLYNAEQRRGSVILGMLLGSDPGPVVSSGPLAQRSIKEWWSQWSLRRGMESLAETICEFLQQSGRVELHTDAAVQHISPSASGWTIQLEDGVVSADHIISALPAKALSSVLPSSCEPLIRELQEINFVTVAVVNLEYEGCVLPLMGFGHLIPSWEDPAVMGIIYDSVTFPEHNRPDGLTTRLTVMMGGAWFQDEFGSPETVTEERLLARAAEAVRIHLQVNTAPCWSRVVLQKDCIPQYYLGHHRRVESMCSFIKDNNLSLSLVGASFNGVSINDVIFSGRTAVDELLGTT
ncbi:protoporphyrinogen oxidase [Cynoglossus semilaevis]|uniref:protoporphyrinogen oxidase n=1 Tax=Cynoglossus semilaevis TaxID=244447 RepID=UPI000497DA1C|nr:protoporphyrinogen oxidase [Cynoglossus semilaevis]XP_024917016.1 protoporphyrinogen oxidase [Cynoglossus semilaevis]XP_024917017.1 protoporphyrinogen oxidase [Cynoglossus semilaevis]